MTLVIVLAGLFYVAWRIYTILPFKKWVKVAVLSVYGFALVSFLLTSFGVIDHLPMPLASFLYVLGNSWLIFVVYAIIIFAVMDVLRLMRLLPGKALKSNIVSSAVVFGIIAVLLTYGAIHYRHKYREEMTIASAKIDTPVKIVLASDLHAGYHNRHREIARWVDMINAEKPDLVLLGGDLVDHSLRAVTADHDASRLKKLQAPVYSCLGNHEYYAGVEDAAKFYETAGITLLKDSLATACGICIIGRDDANNEGRKALYKLMKRAPKGQFTLVLDHQPKDLLEAQLQKVDFQFSGHTHSGQIWPLNWIEKVTFEHSYGPLVKGRTQYYVTSGLGIWGGRFRIATRSEYLVLNLVPETTPEN
ncbi:MAG: metallophosphoesterase [Bacteroidales bacterium]|nr:metallophosphoesterase [Bacteroidales bacterium]